MLSAFLSLVCSCDWVFDSLDTSRAHTHTHTHTVYMGVLEDTHNIVCMQA